MIGRRSVPPQPRGARPMPLGHGEYALAPGTPAHGETPAALGRQECLPHLLPAFGDFGFHEGEGVFGELFFGVEHAAPDFCGGGDLWEGEAEGFDN